MNAGTGDPGGRARRSAPAAAVTMRGRAGALLLACLLLVAAALAGAGSPVRAQTDEVTFAEGEARIDGGSMTYRTFVPTSYVPGSPLVVALHGGNDSVEHTAQVSGWNDLAEEHGFAVVYPQEDPDNGRLGIWNWSAVARRGRDDRAAALVALITRTVVDEIAADSQRVLVSGISAGAGMAVAMAVVYPELYAVVGAEVGCMYGGLRCSHPPACTSDGCETDGLGNVYVTPEDSGRAAFEAMGQRATRTPLLTSYGTVDPAAAGVGQEDLVQQWLVTNDWIDDGEANESVPRSEARSEADHDGGLDFQVRIYDDAGGCPLIERWTIDGLGHDYSGARTGDGTGPGPDMRLRQYHFLIEQTSPDACALRAVNDTGAQPDAGAQQPEPPTDSVAGDSRASLPATGGTLSSTGILLLLMALLVRAARPAATASESNTGADMRL